MSVPEYTYPGQWFDDMGSLVASFMDAPAMGVELARSNLKRDETNSVATNIIKSGTSGYPPEEPDLGA